MKKGKGVTAEMGIRTRIAVGAAFNRCRTVTEHSVLRYWIRLGREKAHAFSFFY